MRLAHAYQEAVEQFGPEKARVISTLASLSAEAGQERFVTESMLSSQLKETEYRLQGRIEAGEHRLDSKIEAMERRLDSKIESVEIRLDTKIDLLRRDVDTKLWAIIGLLATILVGVVTGLLNK